MNMYTIRSTLLWCTIMNYALLIVWFLLYLLPHEWLYRIWRKWFHLSDEQFDGLNFAGMTFYKMCIALFNFVPYLAAADRRVRPRRSRAFASEVNPRGPTLGRARSDQVRLDAGLGSGDHGPASSAASPPVQITQGSSPDRPFADPEARAPRRRFPRRRRLRAPGASMRPSTAVPDAARPGATARSDCAGRGLPLPARRDRAALPDSLLRDSLDRDGRPARDHQPGTTREVQDRSPRPRREHGRRRPSRARSSSCRTATSAADRNQVAVASPRPSRND